MSRRRALVVSLVWLLPAATLTLAAWRMALDRYPAGRGAADHVRQAMALHLLLAGDPAEAAHLLSSLGLRLPPLTYLATAAALFATKSVWAYHIVTLFFGAAFFAFYGLALRRWTDRVGAKLLGLILVCANPAAFDAFSSYDLRAAPLAVTAFCLWLLTAALLRPESTARRWRELGRKALARAWLPVVALASASALAVWLTGAALSHRPSPEWRRYPSGWSNEETAAARILEAFDGRELCDAAFLNYSRSLSTELLEIVLVQRRPLFALRPPLPWDATYDEMPQVCSHIAMERADARGPSPAALQIDRPATAAETPGRWLEDFFRRRAADWRELSRTPIGGGALAIYENVRLSRTRTAPPTLEDYLDFFLGAPADARGRRSLARADRLANRGRCARALRIYQAALDADPTDSSAFSGWMRCLTATAALEDEAAALVAQAARGASSAVIVRLATVRLQELDAAGEPGFALRPIAAAVCRAHAGDRIELARALSRLFADWARRGQLEWAADALHDATGCGALNADGSLTIDVLVRLLEDAAPSPRLDAALRAFPEEILRAVAAALRAMGRCAGALPAYHVLAQMAPDDEALAAAWRECEARVAAMAAGGKPAPSPGRRPSEEAPPYLDIDALRLEMARTPDHEASLEWFAAANEAVLARQRLAARQIYEEAAVDKRVGRACRALAADRSRLLAADGEGAWFDLAGSPVRADWATKLLERWRVYVQVRVAGADPAQRRLLAENAAFAPGVERCADELTLARAQLLIAAKAFAEARALLATINADPELRSIAGDLLEALPQPSPDR